MASSDFKVTIDKLEGPEGWVKWKWHMKMVLRAFELEDIVEGKRTCTVLTDDSTAEQKSKVAEWKKDDAKAASIIAYLIPHYILVVPANTFQGVV